MLEKIKEIYRSTRDGLQALSDCYIEQYKFDPYPCNDYTVTGNGVAHRTADSYLSDTKVIEHLRRIAEDGGDKNS